MQNGSEGARLLREMTSPRHTQSDVARALNVTPQAVSKWLKGAIRPTADLMRKLEDLYGIPMQAWTEFHETDEPADTDAA